MTQLHQLFSDQLAQDMADEGDRAVALEARVSLYDFLHQLVVQLPGDWRADAACRGMDPDTFHKTTAVASTRALETCRKCPVRSECLEWVMGLGVDDGAGVYGGMTAKERRELRRDRATRAA